MIQVLRYLSRDHIARAPLFNYSDISNGTREPESPVMIQVLRYLSRDHLARAVPSRKYLIIKIALETAGQRIGRLLGRGFFPLSLSLPRFVSGNSTELFFRFISSKDNKTINGRNKQKLGMEILFLLFSAAGWNEGKKLDGKTWTQLGT